ARGERLFGSHTDRSGQGLVREWPARPEPPSRLLRPAWPRRPARAPDRLSDDWRRPAEIQGARRGDDDAEGAAANLRLGVRQSEPFMGESAHALSPHIRSTENADRSDLR